MAVSATVKIRQVDLDRLMEWINPERPIAAFLWQFTNEIFLDF